MVMLAMDTTSRVCTVALLGAGSLLAEFSLGVERAHSRWLHPAIARLLDDTGVAGEDITAVAVSAGPGSFTGLRIGVASAKALAYAWGVPVVPVPTLDVLARAAGLWAGWVSPVVVARRGELYAGLHRSGERVEGPVVQEEEAWLERLRSLHEEVLVLGDALDRKDQPLRERLGPGSLRAAPPSMCLPRAALVAELGQELLARGACADAFSVTPVYIKKSQAELVWERKCGREV